MAVIIMGSVHGTCQRVNATPLMIDWIFNIGTSGGKEFQEVYM